MGCRRLHASVCRVDAFRGSAGRSLWIAPDLHNWPGNIRRRFAGMRAGAQRRNLNCCARRARRRCRAADSQFAGAAQPRGRQRPWFAGALRWPLDGGRKRGHRRGAGNRRAAGGQHGLAKYFSGERSAVRHWRCADAAIRYVQQSHGCHASSRSAGAIAVDHRADRLDLLGDRIPSAGNASSAGDRRGHSGGRVRHRILLCGSPSPASPCFRWGSFMCTISVRR